MPLPFQDQRSGTTALYGVMGCATAAALLGIMAFWGFDYSTARFASTHPIVSSTSTSHLPGHLRRQQRLFAQGEDVEDFRRKLMDAAISGRRMEKWTTKGREAKALREAIREAAKESPEPREELEDDEEEYVLADPTTAASFAFGDADMERAEMQPANELEDLRSRAISTWPEKGDAFFAQKVLTVFFSAFAILVVLIAATSDIGLEKVGVAYGLLLASAITVLFIFRLWIDWNYVGDRLKDPKVFYEKSGWYDGELWKKPPEVAQRDQLLYNFQVKPVIDRLRPWLIGSIALLAASFATLLNVRPSDPYAEVPTRSPAAQESTIPRAKYAALEDIEEYDVDE